MSKEEIALYDKEVERTKAALPEEVKNMKVDILCHECHKTSK